MEQINLPNMTEDVSGENTSLFRISPLFPGYGHTVGNSLRRILLSSLPGASVTAVKIDGADHEFTAIPGVKEDVVEIILNLKNLRVTMHDTIEPVTLLLSSKGAGTMSGKDFKANSKVSIANPDLHIATLSSKANFNMEVTIEYGRGYDPVEKRESKALPLGTIAIDSLFTPVRSVTIEVENTRVGKMTNYDELQLTVTTDGTISPADAIKAAAAILVDQFNFIAHFGEAIAAQAIETNTAVEELVGQTSELEEAGIPARVAAILATHGIDSVQALKSASDEELKTISGLGPKALTEIAKVRS